jgi:ribosomal protein L29
MASMKSTDIQKMNKEERMKKIEELKLELIKAKISASKAGTSKMKEIRRMIAKILTFNAQENKQKVLNK